MIAAIAGLAAIAAGLFGVAFEYRVLAGYDFATGESGLVTPELDDPDAFFRELNRLANIGYAVRRLAPWLLVAAVTAVVVRLVLGAHPEARRRADDTDANYRRNDTRTPPAAG